MNDWQDEWQEVYHLLPDSARELMSVIGLEATLLLIRYHGGTQIPVGKNHTQAGKILFAALADTVGDVAAERLTIAYQTQRAISVPMCKDVLIELRNRTIRQQFDRRCTHTSFHQLTAELAREHKITQRHILRILKQADALPSEQDRQLPLF